MKRTKGAKDDTGVINTISSGGDAFLQALITEVQSRPRIWNRKQSDFVTNNYESHTVFEEIEKTLRESCTLNLEGMKFNFFASILDLGTTFSVSQLWNELKKEYNRQLKNEEAGKPIRWKFFGAMSFMKEFMTFV